MVYTAGEGNITFYVDGAQSSTRTYDTRSGNTLSNTTGLTLSLKEDFYIDELRVYDRILDSSEVSEWFEE